MRIRRVQKMKQALWPYLGSGFAAAIEAEDRKGWIESASYDPQGRQPVRFNARRRAGEAACLAFLHDEAQRILRRAGVAQTRVEVFRGAGEMLCSTPGD
jgi:hypothetical protein